jgi:hypothetical protein
VKLKSIENKLFLLHNDRDFEAMAAVTPLKIIQSEDMAMSRCPFLSRR